MIIINDSDTPSSPGERSPLKGGDLSPTTPLMPAPPPPYGVAAAPMPTHIPPQFYHAVPHHPHPHHPHNPHHPYDPHHPHHPHHPSVPEHLHRQRRRRSPFRRFIRAWAVAVLIIFLGGMLMDSLDVNVGRFVGREQKQRNSRGSSGKEWAIARWHRSSKPALPGCQCESVEVPVATPGRVLPIQYPPFVGSASIPLSSVTPES